MAAWTFFKRVMVDRSAATAVEYGLIISLVVLAMIAALKGVADVTVDMWGDVRSEVVNASAD
ncbi:Flp family type IVb pilin [Aurantiacibacter suaedae]|uniref:Flp family type IVb pilin n=1 Tax=Aurantiacibacter suaedae TaxID=2545755 RepID=UPI0010F71B96|nr:Flp family type IVb pilin [Aurantiacibacter suaedae]